MLANVLKGIVAANSLVAIAFLALAAFLGSGQALASLGTALAVGLAGAALFVRSRLIHLRQQMTYVAAQPAHA